MKPFMLLMLMTMGSLGLFAQSLEGCYPNDDPKLTEAEAKFLNEYLKTETKDFDFKDKKIIFVTGNNGNMLTSKSAYFNDILQWNLQYNRRITTSLIRLTDKERAEYGYDAILTKWVKIFTSKSKKQILNKVKEQDNNNQTSIFLKQ